MEEKRGTGIPIWAWIILGAVVVIPCIAAALIILAAVVIDLYSGGM